MRRLILLKILPTPAKTVGQHLIHVWLSEKDIYPLITMNSKGFSKFLLLFCQGILSAWLSHSVKYHQIYHVQIPSTLCHTSNILNYLDFITTCSLAERWEIIRKTAPGTSHLSGNNRNKRIFIKNISSRSRLCFSWGEHVMMNTTKERRFRSVTFYGFIQILA